MSWATEVTDLLNFPYSGDWPTCATHPEGHATVVRSIHAPGAHGSMTMFDDEQYINTPGYCMGDDDVSRTLRVSGVWEKVESKMFQEALGASPGIVIDMGAQIGWYSRMAGIVGREVIAIEPVSEHIELLRQNAPSAHIAQHWIDNTSPVIPADGAPDIAIVKMDLEGNEVHAVRMISSLIRAGKVANILMEVSPIFNTTYKHIVPQVMNWGFSAEVCNPWHPFQVNEVDEVLAMAPQVDMMFRRIA